MKKIVMCIISFLMIGNWLLAQVTEGYISNNLGRIMEIANSDGALPVPRLLIGYDTTGLIRRANSTGSFKVFSNAPNAITLENLNTQNRFGAPGSNDCYEVRFGNDSSRYWINASAFGTGGVLALNQLPFSVYYVGPKSSADTSITGGMKLCIKVSDQDTNGLYTPGERIYIFADLVMPLDSTYDSLSHRMTNPFSSSRSVITNLRLGLSSIPYSQSTFTVPGDGAVPPNGTVLRFVAKTADIIAPVITMPESLFLSYSQEFVYSVSILYPPFPTTFSLLNEPNGMTIDGNGTIHWNIPDSLSENEFVFFIAAENAYGETKQSCTLIRGATQPGIQNFEINISGHNLHVYGVNSGEMPGRPSITSTGMFYKSGGVETNLVYAGGLYIGGLKTDISGLSDTIVVSDVEFSSEFQPGRILNQGPLGSLVAENYTTVSTFFALPYDYSSWPAEAPHDEMGNPLKLSSVDTWNVFNDIDSALNPPNAQHSLAPRMGLEIQRQIFMFKEHPFNNALLCRLLIINKSNYDYNSSHIGLWTDPDVGYDTQRDLIGTDSAISLVYAYNSSATTDLSNTAFGCLLLSKFITIPQWSFKLIPHRFGIFSDI